MLIKEVCTISKLTKKAIEYYVEKGLVSPIVLENGYRDFSTDDINQLRKISVLRKLGLGTDDIKIALFDESGQVLKKLSTQKELKLEREKIKQSIFNKLSIGTDWEEINSEIESIEKNETIIERLLYAFPGYYGRFISLHFSRFLNEPLTTPEQQVAYDEIFSFLDNTPALEFPKDVEEFLIKTTDHISTQDIQKMEDDIKETIEDTEKFLAEYKEVLNQYLAFKQSDKYKNSPAYKIESMLKEFNKSSGYNDVFIPAMKKLSNYYSDYYKQLEIANKKLLLNYPEIERLRD